MDRSLTNIQNCLHHTILNDTENKKPKCANAVDLTREIVVSLALPWKIKNQEPRASSAVAKTKTKQKKTEANIEWLDICVRLFIYFCR